MNTAFGMSMILQLFALCSALPREVTMGQLTDSIREYLDGGAPQTKAAPSRSESSWRWSENDRSVTVTIGGRVEFTDDSTDVKSISNDGLFVLNEKSKEVERKLEVTAHPGGGVEHAYSLNGQSHVFDRESQAWFARALSTTLARSGLDAESRAERLLKEGGARRLIVESATARSDRARRIYLETALKSNNLDPASLQDVMGAISSSVSSESERANLLIAASGAVLSRPDLCSAFFQAVGKLDSSFEQKRVLTAIFKSPKALSREALLDALMAAKRIPFEHDKVEFLLEHANLYLGDSELRNEFARTAASIRSEAQRRRVEALLDSNTKTSN